MQQRLSRLNRGTWLLCGILLFNAGLTAADPAAPAPPPTPVPAPMPTAADFELLKEQLAAQQAEIEKLRAELHDRAKGNADVKALRTQPATIAAAAPVPSPSAAAAPDPPAPSPAPAPTPAPDPQQMLPPGTHAPLQIQLGNITIQPIGFMDATVVWRNVNAGSGIGSNFGSIPYGNTLNSNLSETRFSIQNSRLGFRVDGDWKGAHFIGYNEFDFLGQSAANNIGVTNGAFVPRIRLYWIDMRKNKYEFLAGQSWSLLTPNRYGLSPLPQDVFYSQVMDVNYLIGLTWTRQLGFRFVYHPTGKIAMGLALENPNQYMGGYGGGPQIVLPAGLTSVAGAQLDNGSANFLSTPNLHPDIIAKIAFDPSKRLHFEFAGIERDFKIANPNTFQTFTATGGGGSVNANFELFKGFRLISNNFYGDGGGRYMFGNAPDVVVRPNGSLSPLHSSGLNEGFEAQVSPNTMLWGYYGAIFIGKDVAVDTNGKLVGYGYPGSSNAMNRNVQEGTIGITQTFWKDPRYGALSFIGQYEYLTRRPWYVAPGALSNAADHTVYLDLRYTLPGGAPNAEP